MSRIIGVSNHKGGVGKTTVVANLGFALARYFKVLLVDLDPQANLSSGLGYRDSDENIGKYFKEVIHFRKPVVTPYIVNEYIHIIPAKIDLIQIENQLRETLRSENVLKEILLPFKGKYDLILLDCPPAYNLLTINALTSSNLILVPAKPELFSIDGIELIKKFADKNKISFKIAFNEVVAQSKFHQKIINQAKKKFEENLLENKVRKTIALAEAFEHAQGIFQYKSTSLGAFDFINLADELLPFI